MKIRITPGALLMVLALAMAPGDALGASVVAVLFHEGGHLLAAAPLGIRLRLLELDLLGAKLYPAGQLPSFGAEWCLAAAGPAASFLLALLCAPLSHPFFRVLCKVSLSLGVFNLLPVAGMDGGRMLFSLASMVLEERAAQRVSEICSYVSLLFLFALSACMLLRFGQSFTLAVLSASLFAKIFLPVKNGGTV